MDARLEKSASEGDAEAQFEMGNYFASKSVSHKKAPSDTRRAFAWYLKAATKGHANAQYRLALAYADGVGVHTDLIQAAEWFKKAAEQGNAWAQFRLGQCYRNGNGVKANLETAISWFQKAAEQEHEKSRASLELAQGILLQDKSNPSPEILSAAQTQTNLPAESIQACKNLIGKAEAQAIPTATPNVTSPISVSDNYLLPIEEQRWICSVIALEKACGEAGFKMEEIQHQIDFFNRYPNMKAFYEQQKMPGATPPMQVGDVNTTTKTIEKNGTENSTPKPMIGNIGELAGTASKEEFVNSGISTTRESKLGDVIDGAVRFVGMVLQFIVGLILFILFLLVFQALFGSCPLMHPSQPD